MTRVRVLSLSMAIGLLACSEPPAPTVPGAPADVTVSFGDGAVTVAWKAPASDGGSPVTGYTVVSAPGEATATVDGSTLTAQLTGLTNGISYTFQVFATNAVGDGPLSLAAAPVEPGTVPGAPSVTSVVAGNAQVTLEWTAPADGGSPLTGYTITSSSGDLSTQLPGHTTSTVISGLTNGTPYSFVIVATNEHGAGPASSPSETVIPRTVPDAVTEVVAVRGNAQVTLTWQASASDGGAELAGYRVTPVPAGAAVTVDADTLTATVVDLPNGVAIAFDVVAFNAVGDSEPVTSNEVVPATVPDAPAAAEAVRGDREVTLTWTAPASDGGSAVTGYVVTATPGDVSVTTEALTATVNGLANGTEYVFSIAAVNAVGASATLDTLAVTPAAVPSGPGLVEVVTGDGAVVVSWPGAEDNGSAVTGYVVTSTPAGFGASLDADARSVAIDGLTNGTAYVFHVAAINGVGQGPDESSHPATPLGPPDAGKTTLTANRRSATADGTDAITLTVVARDAMGNALPEREVGFSADGALTLSTPHGYADDQGVFTTEVTAAQWGRYRITVQVGGASGPDRSVEVEFTVPACQGELPIALPASIALTVGATHVANGDLDGDGTGDLAFTSTMPNSLHVVMGATVDGSRSQTRIALPGIARSVTLLDANGDGHQDALVGFDDPVSLGVFDGLGDGTFAAPRYLTTPVVPIAVAQHPDTGALLILDSASVVLFEADDEGEYTASAPYPVGAGRTSLTLVDVDGNGHQDVVATGNGVAPALLPGLEDGTFDTAVDFLTTSLVSALAFGDFDGDGDQDVAWVQNDAVVRVRFNEGGGVYGAAIEHTLEGILDLLVAADFDEDGSDDLAAGSKLSGTMYRMSGADGSFPASARESVLGNANLEALLVHRQGGRAMLLSAQMGRFRFPFDRQVQPEYVGVGPSLRAVSGDLNGDGFLDIVGVDEADGINPNMYVTLSQDAPRTLGAPVEYPDAGPSPGVVLADMNGDGRPDVVVPRTKHGAHSVDVWLTGNDGTLERISRVPTCEGPNQVQTGDLNADGHLDVVVVCTGNTTTLTGGGVIAMLGDGEGNLDPQPLLNVGMIPSSVTMGDFNGDGHLDVAASSLYGGHVTVLAGDGSGRLTVLSRLFQDAPTYAVTAGHLDDDMNLDLVITLPLSNQIVAWKGQGDGTFTELARITAAGAGRITVADLDRDGRSEILAEGIINAGWIHLWRGVGQADSSIVSFGRPGGASVEPVDFDGDGLLDLVIGGLAVAFQPACE